MNKKRLSVLTDMMRAAVARGECAGVQAMVVREGREEYFGLAGMADIEADRPMTRDTIFRMFSSSKCVTGLAAVMCIERGLLSLRAPVHEYLPGFRDLRYWNGTGEVPLSMPLLVRNVLNMTSGIAYPGGTVAGQATAALVEEMNRDAEQGIITPTVDFANRLGRCPLDFAPGTSWQYGFNADVAGALIEVVSGMAFGDFLRKEIFDPLGMVDTGFRVDAARRERMAMTYRSSSDGKLSPFPEAGLSLGLRDYDERTSFESGGAGLVSTIDDWARLMRFFQSDGTIDGHRLLSPYGMRFLRTPQLTERQAKAFCGCDCDGQNYANFMNIKVADGPTNNFCNVGTFGWDGWLGTNSFADPVEKLSLIVLLQGLPSATVRQLPWAMRPPVYAALDD